MIRGIVLFVASLFAIAQPATAAQFLLTGTATGSVTTNVGCGGCEVVTPATRGFSFILNPASAFSYGYTEYAPGKFSFMDYGEDFHTTFVQGLFELIGTKYVGTSLWAYDTGSTCVSGRTCSSFSASSFSVVDLSDTTVPEPATWAMLMVGLFVVGASVRRRGWQRLPVPQF